MGGETERRYVSRTLKQGKEIPMEKNEKSTRDQKSVTGAGETAKKKMFTPMQELARAFKAYHQDIPPDTIAYIHSPFKKEEIPSDVQIRHYEMFSPYSRGDEKEK